MDNFKEYDDYLAAIELRNFKRSGKKHKNKNAQKTHEQKYTDKLIHRLLVNGFHVLRYDAFISNSIYLKLDYGAAGTIRISDHASKKKHKSYTYTVLTHRHKITKPGEIITSALVLKNAKIKHFGPDAYLRMMDSGKAKLGVKPGFWSNCIEVLY